MISVEKKNEFLCDKKLPQIDNNNNKNKNTENNNNNNDKNRVKHYACVWGTRLSEFEFSGEKWGKQLP